MKDKASTIFAIFLLVVFLGAVTQAYFRYLHVNGVVERKDNYSNSDYYIVVLTKNNKEKKLSVSQCQWNKINVGDTVVNSKVMIKHK